MPNPPLCTVLVNGQPCGYVAVGDTMKDKLADLFRHEQSHLPANGQ